MIKPQKLYFSPDVVLYPLLFVIIMWLVFWFEIRFGEDFTPYGIHPGSVEGIRGVLFGPFIHGNLKHLFNNSIPMLVLGTALFYFYRPLRWQVFILGFVITGLITWAIGRPANHIGASGVTHGLFFFLFVASIFRRDKSSVAIMMITFLLYGGMTMSIFPREEGISFEYHFFGALAGVIAAIIWRNSDPKPVVKLYEWEKKSFNDDTEIGDEWQVDKASEQEDKPRLH